MYTPGMKTIASLASIAILTAGISAQATTSSSSTFDFDSAISAAGTETTSFDLYTTNGSLGPGVLDTSSRFGLYSSATPVVGPIGNGTTANGTATNGTATMTSRGGAGSSATGGIGSGSGGESGTSGGSGGSGGSSAPAATGNVAASAGALWAEGAGLLVGIGAVMAAL